MATNRWLGLGLCATLTLLAACQQTALDGTRPGAFRLGDPAAGTTGAVAAPQAATYAMNLPAGTGPEPAIVVAGAPAGDPAATPTPAATATPRRRAGGGGSSGGGSAPVATPTPTPAPTPPVLAPISGTSTFGNPADPLQIDGVRFDPDFATNGRLHLAFSVEGADGADLDARLEPGAARAVMSFSDTPPEPAASVAPSPVASAPSPVGASPGPYRLRGLEALSVTVEGLTPGVGRPPLDTILAIDSTGSMASTDPQKLRIGAAKDFVDQMRPSDQLAIMDFADGLSPNPLLPDPVFDAFPDMRLLHPMSKDEAGAKAAIDQVLEVGGTNLYDALLKGIEYLAAQNGNRPLALVALTDGQDNMSTATIEQVAAAAKAHDVLLMLLAFSGYDEHAMHTITTEAGGWFVGAEDPTTLEGQFGAAVHTLGGNAQAIVIVPADQRIANHMAGRLTVTIDGLDYSGTFNVAPPGP